MTIKVVKPHARGVTYRKGRHMRKQPTPARFLFPEMAIGRDNPWVTKAGAISRKSRSQKSGLTTLELCAGAGGQALGFEEAGIGHAALVEVDKNACATLLLNRPEWNVLQADVNNLVGSTFKGV